MKKLILTLVLPLLTIVSVMAMSESKIRTHARFISDRMAYELDLTPMQYDDVFEVNYDFIYRINRVMDDVVRGYYDAIDSYYHYLDHRNDDLRFILSSSQFARFLAADYFYRPIYTNGINWSFRIYTIYSNRTFFYYDSPRGYKTYNGLHCREYYPNGYYVSRYTSYAHHASTVHIVGSNHFETHRRSDFGHNLRSRNENKVYNNYSNPNQKNRTKDDRYHDNSGNRNSQSINNRPAPSRSENRVDKAPAPKKEKGPAAGVVRSGRR